MGGRVIFYGSTRITAPNFSLHARQFSKFSFLCNFLQKHSSNIHSLIGGSRRQVLPLAGTDGHNCHFICTACPCCTFTASMVDCTTTRKNALKASQNGSNMAKKITTWILPNGYLVGWMDGLLQASSLQALPHPQAFCFDVQFPC